MPLILRLQLQNIIAGDQRLPARGGRVGAPAESLRRWLRCWLLLLGLLLGLLLLIHLMQLAVLPPGLEAALHCGRYRGAARTCSLHVPPLRAALWW